MSRDIVILGNFGWEVAFAAHAQIAANKWLEIAVKNLVDIAYFYARAKVFRHTVGLQDVAADLGAELDVELGVFEFTGGSLFLVELVLVELGAHHLHGALFILVLRALVLAAGDEAGWECG